MKNLLFPVLVGFLGLGQLFASQLSSAFVIDRVEASVNSGLVLLSDVRGFRGSLSLRQQLDPLFAETHLASLGTSAKDTDIIEFLIDERLVAQAFPVTDTEAEAQINQIQSNNHIDRTQLKAAITEQGFTFDEYFELIRISSSKRNLIDRDIRTKVTISDDDVKNQYYNQYSKSQPGANSYRIQMITVTVKNFKSSAAAKEVIDRSFAAVQAGEAFDDVAKRMSDGPTASSGGDLGMLPEDQLNTNIKEQLKNLKIGQVSPVFGSPQTSFNLIRLVDIKSNDDERFQKMKEPIRNQLIAAEYQHQIGLWLERHRQSSFIHRAGEAAVSGLPVAP